jgi:histone deacetylase 6
MGSRTDPRDVLNLTLVLISYSSHMHQGELSASAPVSRASPSRDIMDVEYNGSRQVTASQDKVSYLPRPRASSEPLESKHLEYTIGYVFHPQMMSHICVDGHPEQPQRITAIYSILQENGLLDKMKHIPIRKVKREEALLVHSEDLWDKVIAISSQYL